MNHKEIVASLKTTGYSVYSRPYEEVKSKNTRDKVMLCVALPEVISEGNADNQKWRKHMEAYTIDVVLRSPEPVEPCLELLDQVLAILIATKLDKTWLRKSIFNIARTDQEEENIEQYQVTFTTQETKSYE